MGKVIGVGGVFVKAPDAAVLGEWYARVLGFEIQEWGGAMCRRRPAGTRSGRRSRPPATISTPRRMA